MIEEIKKVENGFSITTDKGEFFLDFSKMNEIIGFKDDVVLGHGDGNLVSLNIVTDDYELWTPYKDKPYKLFEIELCTSLCYFQCETEDEEEVYEPVFEYLKKCPTCNYIQELTALLINEYIKTQDEEEAGYGLSELFPPDYISPEDSSNLHHKYNPEFEYVLQLARMIVELEDK